METEISDSEIDSVYEKLKISAEKRGYFLNPDEKFAKALVRSLLTNGRRYGYWACPCRLASGKREEDNDIICPCDYRDSDVKERGACYCALYVSKEISGGRKKAMPVPERRLPFSERKMNEKPEIKNNEPEKKQSIPVWRCKVCGYLCARDSPPDTCPICGVDSDRFERFM